MRAGASVVVESPQTPVDDLRSASCAWKADELVHVRS